MECIQECLEDLDQTGTLPILTDEDLADFEVIVIFYLQIDYASRP